MTLRFGDFGLGVIILLSVVLSSLAPASATEPPDAKEAARMRAVLNMKGPLPPALATEQQEYKQRLEKARELGNHRIDPRLFTNAINRAAKQYLISTGVTPEKAETLYRPATPPLRWRGMPTTGDVRVFALLIDFSDFPSSNTVSAVNDNLFGPGSPSNFPRESLARYYDRASYGKLDLSNGSTLGWYRPSVPRSAIAQTRLGRENLIEEAIQHFDAQGHDFSQYDNNGDGKIDYFLVIWTGPDNGWSNFWWGYQTSFSNQSFRVDGVTLGKYSWQWESLPVGGTFNSRVVIHETGHALGLPDYYDYDDAIGPRGGVGGLDMMHGNWGDHNCFSKWVLDWITPTVVASGSQTVNLRSSGTTEDCIVVWPGVASSNPFGEMFVVQNRQRVANDTGWPSDGILAWHVDATLDISGTNYAFDNSFTDHKLIRLMEADGLEEIENGGGGNAGDFYGAGQVLDMLSKPNTLQYTGITSGVSIRTIGTPSDNMSVTVAIGAQETMQVLPATGLDSTKEPGKPATSVSASFTLKNTGANPMDWSASATVPWVDLSATSGTLAAGEQVSVMGSLNANADDLPGGIHTGLFRFANDTLGVGANERPIKFSAIRRPENDRFDTATMMDGISGTLSGSNVFATEETGEPKHGGVVNGGTSVWWKWVPASSGEVTFDTDGSDFDTVMSVYGGHSLPRLTSLDFDDDGLGIGGGGSKIKITAQAGMAYFIAVDGWSKNTGNIILNWSQSDTPPPLLSSILPSARSGKINGALSAFASVINIGKTTANNCSISLPTGETSGFSYQTTNSSNGLTGTANTPVNIGAGVTQSFVFQVIPDRVFTGDQVGLVFNCDNTIAAASIPGLNRLQISSGVNDVADLIAIASTTNMNGIVDIPGDVGTGVFSAATVNIGSAGTFLASVDDAEIGLALNPLICKTDSQGTCELPPSASVPFTLATNEIALFSVFVVGQGNILLDAANSRLFLRLDENGVPRGATSVAVRTVPTE